MFCKSALTETSLQDAGQALDIDFKSKAERIVYAFVSMAVRAAREDPLSTRAFARLYTAGIEPDPAFTNPKTSSFPDALSGLGIEQRLVPMQESIEDAEGDERRWQQLILILAIVEGRLRPVGHGLSVLGDIIDGSLDKPPKDEPLRPIHDCTKGKFYDNHTRTYIDDQGNPDQQTVPVLADFETSRTATREVLGSGGPSLTTREERGLKAWQGILRQSLRPVEDWEGGINYNDFRHAIAHMNIGLDEDRTLLDRGKVMHAFLEAETETKLLEIDEEALDEIVEEAWMLMGISWAWQLSLNTLDLWLSAKVFPDVPYPQEEHHAADRDPEYVGRATSVLAMMAAAGA